MLWRLFSGYYSDTCGLLERVSRRERSSTHLGLERTLDALESSQLRHCAGILEQSLRLSAKRGLLSPFTSSVSHHTQRETWSSQYSLQSPARTRAPDDSGPYYYFLLCPLPASLAALNTPAYSDHRASTLTILLKKYLDAPLFFFPGFSSNAILGERSLSLSYRRLRLPCQLPDTVFLLLPKCGKLTAEAMMSSVRNIY